MSSYLEVALKAARRKQASQLKDVHPADASTFGDDGEGIREAKPAILEALRNRPATCSRDCYELEPGIWIHRPHTGCTTIKPETVAPQHKVAVTCWHCRGQKKCGCSACWQGGPRDCAACKGTGQGWRWVQ